MKNDGTGTDCVILSGIHAYYGPEELVGKTLIAITNLPPRAMMDLVMAAIFFLIGFLFYRSNEKPYDAMADSFFIGAVIDFVFPIKGTFDRMGHMVRHVYSFTDRMT